MSTTKYVAIIPGKDFKILDSDTVKLVKELCGKIPQNGMRYLNEDTGDIVLQSNNQHDILDSVKNNAWAHTVRPSKIKIGSKIYIVPSNPLQFEYGVGAIGISFTATGEAYKDNDPSLLWTSEHVKDQP